MAIALASLLKTGDGREDAASASTTPVDTFENTLASEAGKGFAGWVMKVLTRRAKTDPGLKSSIERMASAGDSANHDELVKEIVVALRDEPGLLEDAQHRLASISVTASGVRSVAVGGDSRGIINTGDIGS